MTGPEEAQPSPRRRWPWVLLASAMAIVIVAVLLALTQPWNSAAPAPTSTTTSTKTPTPSSSPTDDPAPQPDYSTGAPIGAQEPPVAPDAPATGDGVQASLSKVEKVQGTAVAPGEISGPALRITVTVVNTGDTALDLGYVVVNAYTGADQAPTNTVMQPGGKPFAGHLAPGASAKGVYIFVIPEHQRGDVSIVVDYRVGKPALVFRGDLG